jgi:hypothetical protein
MTKKDLLRRGWTIPLIIQFAPVPSRTENPHCQNGSPMYVYDDNVVAQIENSVEFKIEYIERALNRRRYSNTKLLDKEILNDCYALG